VTFREAWSRCCEGSYGLRTNPQALLVVEAGSVRRTVAAEMRLAATALHGLLGAPTAAAAAYAVLECKHIQHDTLSGAHVAFCCRAC